MQDETKEGKEEDDDDENDDDDHMVFKTHMVRPVSRVPRRQKLEDGAMQSQHPNATVHESKRLKARVIQSQDSNGRCLTSQLHTTETKRLCNLCTQQGLRTNIDIHKPRMFWLMFASS